MVSHLNISSLPETADKIHFIPCEIKYDGKANIGEYFETTIRLENEGKMTASLRGRPLHGKTVTVPDGYTGLIVKETKKAFTEEEQQELSSVQTFKQFTAWNLDREPSAEDKLQQALGWIDIAKELHRPVGEESSQLSSQRSIVDK